MIELRDDSLVFSFPEVHPKAVLRVEFQRTLRIPDDQRTYHLPPGLGRFPLRHVDDFAAGVPGAWLAHGGTMLPMYQSEALWLNFSSPSRYPFAVKVAAGKINAVTGEHWSNGLHRDPQDYLDVPTQPWLDGFCVEKGIIRQFVAMPLGTDYTAEEQLTGEGEHGGIQIVAFPLKREAYRPPSRTRVEEFADFGAVMSEMAVYSADMGLAPGGKMRQEIYDDTHAFADWDLRHSSRCFIHLANSVTWHAITGENPPPTPATAAAYTRAGFPWFEYYASDTKALEGAERLRGVKSVAALSREKRETVLTENEPVDPKNVVQLRRGLRPSQVREGVF